MRRNTHGHMTQSGQEGETAKMNSESEVVVNPLSHCWHAGPGRSCSRCGEVPVCREVDSICEGCARKSPPQQESRTRFVPGTSTHVCNGLRQLPLNAPKAGCKHFNKSCPVSVGSAVYIINEKKLLCCLSAFVLTYKRIFATLHACVFPRMASQPSKVQRR